MLLVWKFLILTEVFILKPLQLDKYKNYDFGRCPRVYCCGQPCLPVGQSDIPRSSTVKIYCPKCEDIYYPRSKYQGSILLFCELFYLLFFFFLKKGLISDLHPKLRYLCILHALDVHALAYVHLLLMLTLEQLI